MTRKLRPYDEPPKRRRSLIPNAPDSAGGLFLVVAILWLLAAAGIGMLAAAERLFPDVLKVAFNVPFGSGIGVEITGPSVASMTTWARAVLLFSFASGMRLAVSMLTSRI